MKLLVVLSLFVASAVCQYVPDRDRDAVVLRSDYRSNIGDGNYEYNYETSNGLAAAEQGVLKDPGSDRAAMEVRGQYSYVGPDGVSYSVNYVANENGFQPQGAHIPQ